MDVPERQDEPAPEAAAAALPHAAVDPQITAMARPHSATAPATAPEREDIDLVRGPPVKKRMILPKNAPPSSVLQFFSVWRSLPHPSANPARPLPVPPARLAHPPAPPTVQRTVELRPTLNAGCDGAGPGPSFEAHLVQQGVQRALEVSARPPANMKRKRLNKTPARAVRTDLRIWQELMFCLEDVLSNAKLRGKQDAFDAGEQAHSWPPRRSADPLCWHWRQATDHSDGCWLCSRLLVADAADFHGQVWAVSPA
eukprot:350136-Chlamydomonas_euryale.AAC.15